MNKLLYLSLCITLFAFSFPLAIIADIDSLPLTCAELKALSSDDVINGNVIIELYRAYPGIVNDITNLPKYELPLASEYIFIFGEGIVYSDRGAVKNMEGYIIPSGVDLDSSWSTNLDCSTYMRYCKYDISDDLIGELLKIISENEGELLPGKTIRGYAYQAKLRITYNGREGKLIETTELGIEDESKLEIIDSLIHRIREIEWAADIEVCEWPDFRRELKALKEEYGWRTMSEDHTYTYIDVSYLYEEKGLVSEAG